MRTRLTKHALSNLVRDKLIAMEDLIEVKDYEFATLKGPVKLSVLFGDKRDLFVIHNMGLTCPNCTMWADGFNGLFPHVADRAAFVVSSPDAPEKQAAFAQSRGWKFPMVSDATKTFAGDMGFLSDKGQAQPGVSAFQRTRKSSASRPPASIRTMISARPGGCSTCCRKAPMAGGRSSVTADQLSAKSTGACDITRAVAISCHLPLETTPKN